MVLLNGQRYKVQKTQQGKKLWKFALSKGLLLKCGIFAFLSEKRREKIWCNKKSVKIDKYRGSLDIEGKLIIYLFNMMYLWSNRQNYSKDQSSKPDYQSSKSALSGFISF